MAQPTLFTAALLFGALTLPWHVIGPDLAFAEDQKSKTAPQSKAVKPKTEPKFHTAETAAKAKACFGVAPHIDKLVPDEGKPGAKVTIKGMQFGSPECLRGVSFGPGQAAVFTMRNESTIVATVPTISRKGLVIVTVTTASGEDSKAFLLK